MNARPLSSFSRALFLATSFAIILVAVGRLAGQNAAPSLLVLSREGRRTIPLTTSGGQEMVSLDDLASIFQLSVRDERDALTVSYKGRTIVLTPDQAIASVSGRVIALPVPPVKAGGRWTVPIDFVSRALLPIYDARLELRRPSHLLIVGDLRVPRVVIRQEQSGAGERVTIETTPRATATVSQEGSQRLTVKFDVDALDVALPPTQSPGVIQAFRTADDTTLAIDLGPRFVSARSSTQIVDASARLVIDLPTATDASAAAPPAPPPGEPTPAELPSIVSSGPSVRTLVIDAGHGGDDAGARGAKGLAEKDVTLAVARKLKAAVESRLGLRVLMTREDDRAVAITNRTALANNSKADLFVSLHANASFRDGVTGAAALVAAFDPARVAANPLTPERLPAFGGGFRDIELVPWNLAQIRYKDQSDVFARMIADGFQDRVPLAARPVDHAPLRVLESANMPAVLVEVGYLTNAAQETQLADNAFQSALVQGMTDAIARFRDAVAGAEGAVR